MHERRHEDEEHHVGLELELREARQRPEPEAPEDEHDRVRHGKLAR